ncbi:MAG TPA: N-acetylmuramoyl-L-alanine amidase, partial [Acidimicrobiia bacterium]
MGELSRRQFIGKAAGRATVVPPLGTSPACPDIHPRSEWATNRPPRGPLDAEDVRFLLVHHSASRSDHDPGDVPGILRSFYDFHTGPEKGWNDVAYNFLVDSGGGIWEGRSGSIVGAVAGDATGGNQGSSQLVCLIGDFDDTRPSDASLASLVAVLAWLADRFGISTEPGATTTFTSGGSNLWPAGSSVTTPTITGHRTMSRTSCPGSNLNSYVTGALMRDVTVERRRANPVGGDEMSQVSTSGEDPGTGETSS